MTRKPVWKTYGKNKPLWKGGVAYTLVCVVLWPIPVFQVLHAESAAVLAAVGFLVAAFGFGNQSEIELRDLVRALLDQVLLVVVPLVLMTLSLWWAPNAGYLTGLVLFLVFVIPSVVLGAAVASVIRRLTSRFFGLCIIVVWLVLVVGGTLADLARFPQFYVYNHVFGAVLGPIYDEELSIRGSLFVFRFFTLILAGALFCASRWLGGSRSRWVTTSAAVGITCSVLGMFYGHALGFNTDSARIREVLGSELTTPHFRVVYDREGFGEAEIGRVGRELEFRYASFREKLGISPRKPISVYLYPDADVKAQLTGARYTNVAPVWLAEPQLHILMSSFDAVMPHELAHAFSREFGLPLVKASTQIGLVEGFAVAMEPPDGTPDAHTRAASAIRFAERAGLNAEDVSDVVGSLSASSFWTGRGAVSYTMTGSFASFLIDTYGIEKFKSAYPFASLSTTYGVEPSLLADLWLDFLETVPVDTLERDFATQRLSRTSIFERPSPHYLPPYIKAYRKVVNGWAKYDLESTRARLNAVFDLRAEFEPAKILHARLLLAENKPQEVLDYFGSDLTGSSSRLVTLGDALVVSGDPARARRTYQAALEQTDPYDRDERALLWIRSEAAVFSDARAILNKYIQPRLRAIELKAFDGPGTVIPVIRARLYEEARDWESASLEYDRFLNERNGGDPPSIVARVLVWAGEVAFLQNRITESLSMLTRARSLYVSVGDTWEVERIDDRITLLSFVKSERK